MLGSVASSSSSPANSGEVQFDKNSPMGKLQEFGKAMEQSNKKMEAAQKSGDPNAATAAAMDTLGALLGGGKKVDPLHAGHVSLIQAARKETERRLTRKVFDRLMHIGRRLCTSGS